MESNVLAYLGVEMIWIAYNDFPARITL